VTGCKINVSEFVEDEDPLLRIWRKSYHGDNSVMSLERSYWRRMLRPRCWIRVLSWRSS